LGTGTWSRTIALTAGWQCLDRLLWSLVCAALALAPAQAECQGIVQGAIDQLLLRAQPGAHLLERPSGIIRPVSLDRLQALLLQAQSQAGLFQSLDHGKPVQLGGCLHSQVKLFLPARRPFFGQRLAFTQHLQDFFHAPLAVTREQLHACLGAGGKCQVHLLAKGL
jgi:hypothetical protein